MGKAQRGKREVRERKTNLEFRVDKESKRILIQAC
jgi:hypothetical protein